MLITVQLAHKKNNGLKLNLTLSNLSILKTGKVKAMRFTTLEVISEVLQCQPGNILEFRAGRK